MENGNVDNGNVDNGNVDNGDGENGVDSAIMTTPDELLAVLDDLGISTTTHDHPPVKTVEEALVHWADIPGVHCKNLFLRDAKKAYWLVVVPFDRQVQLKTLPDVIGSKRLSFASDDRLRQVLAVEPGSVTPFGLINDRAHAVNVVLDGWMMGQGLLNFHPLVNTRTTTIAPQDLLRFITHCGHQPCIIDLH